MTLWGAVGAQGMAGVVRLGDPLSAGAGEASGAHDADGIVTAVVTRVSGGVDAGVQKLKYSARGFRNRKRFRPSTFTSAVLISTPPVSTADPPIHPIS